MDPAAATKLPPTSIDDTMPVAAAPRFSPGGGGEARADYPELVTVSPEHYVQGQEIARGGMGRIRAARDPSSADFRNGAAELGARIASCCAAP